MMAQLGAYSMFACSTCCDDDICWFAGLLVNKYGVDVFQVRAYTMSTSHPDL
ncbi:hypothetical protein M430DRAFT_187810 [Amorphotheca resinae ATCC 22711]|uniref:Uncharacterized protein n=1 Tax=Amorphotheca resinae ATCC 22711 TaxID=857342 RepID=A0A2T3AQV3_AMORE|nr:hypothetical protein M430DRAFT_187810 [Amorphotheca resinae ATCC 22711]PSS08643.1 hypothetical protein M430DRAFT_187810 [Amorphotheca resinae ATCC 22711]